MNESQGRGEVLVNTQEAAKRLGVSPSTMVNWRRRKYGPPFVMVSRLVRYRVADLAVFIERGVVETTTTVAMTTPTTIANVAMSAKPETATTAPSGASKP